MLYCRLLAMLKLYGAFLIINACFLSFLKSTHSSIVLLKLNFTRSLYFENSSVVTHIMPAVLQSLIMSHTKLLFLIYIFRQFQKDQLSTLQLLFRQLRSNCDLLRVSVVVVFKKSINYTKMKNLS